MALVVRDINGVPTGGWQFPVAQTGFTVRGPNWHVLLLNLKKHCDANNVPVPTEQEVIDWSCKNLAIACFDNETKLPLVNAYSLGLPVVLPGCCGKKPA